jgi:hypothetical protein
MDNLQGKVLMPPHLETLGKTLTAILCVSLLSGCFGKVVKEGAELAAKKAEDALTQKLPDSGAESAEQAFSDALAASRRAADKDVSSSDTVDSGGLIGSYLALKLSAEAAKALLNFERTKDAFELHPFRAYYTGELSTSDSRLDMRFEVSLNRGCDWNFEIVASGEKGDGTSTIVKDIYRERLDGGAAIHRSSVEVIDSQGLIMLKEDAQEVMVETQSGFDLEFIYPEEKTISIEQGALFFISATALELSMIREGTMKFWYRYAFPSSEQYFQIADVSVEPFVIGQLDLWRLETLVGDVEDGTEVFGLEERIMTRNGVEVAVRYRDDDSEMKFWLTGLEELPVETCN